MSNEYLFILGCQHLIQHTIKKLIYLTVMDSTTWGEFLQFPWMAVHVILSFLVSISLFSFTIYFLVSHPALGILLKRKRKKRSENKAEKERTTWTAVLSNCKKSGTFRVLQHIKTTCHGENILTVFSGVKFKQLNPPSTHCLRSQFELNTKSRTL